MSEKQTASGRSSIQKTLAEYRSQCTELEQWMEGELSFIEDLCAGLEQKITVKENQRNLITEEGKADQDKVISKLTVQVEQQESQASDLQEKLSIAQNELNRSRELFEAQLNEASHPSPEILNTLKEIEKERTELLSQLENSQENLNTLDVIKSALDVTKHELTEAKSSIEVYQQKDITHKSNRASAENESAALESELEHVRSRAAELYETVDEQKRELAQQRAEMGEELKSLRKIIETLVTDKSQESMQPKQPVKSDIKEPEKGNLAKTPSDPIVNSVMAQFAKLQKDVQSRRARKE